MSAHGGGAPHISMKLESYQLFVKTKVLGQLQCNFLGKDGPTKTDEFLEKFQTAFDPPPPHFRDKIATKVRMFSMAGLLCII